MGRSDWAAWTQAAGAILALVVALGLAWRAEHNRRQDELNRQQEAREITEKAIHSARLFAGWLRRHLASQLHACERIDEAALRVGARLIVEVIDLGRSNPVHLLPVHLQGHLFELRALAAEAEHLANVVASRPGIWREHAKEYRDLEDQAKALVGAFSLDEYEEKPTDADYTDYDGAVDVVNTKVS